MNKLYQTKDDFDFFQKKFRFDKNLASSRKVHKFTQLETVVQFYFQ